MKLQKAYKFGENPRVKGHIYSEQWGVEYEYFEEPFYKKDSIIYETEWKGMADEVRNQFCLDFPRKDYKIIKITYH